MPYVYRGFPFWLVDGSSVVCGGRPRCSQGPYLSGHKPVLEGSALVTWPPPRPHLLTQSSWELGFQQVKGRIYYYFFPWS